MRLSARWVSPLNVASLINERFCYTDSLLNERFPDGSPSSTWFCGHSWASGAVLEGLAGKILDMEKNNRDIILCCEN